MSMLMKRIVITAFFCSFVHAGLSANSIKSLESDFKQPPNSAKPQTWWHWINGNIAKEGITADLEAMKQVGLGGAQIFNVKCYIPGGPVTFMSDSWREMFKHTAAECQRLCLDLSIHNCDGWSESGGPWVTPEQSMQRVVSSEIHVTGPQKFAKALPQPESVRDFYRDIAVLAFPTPDGEQTSITKLSPKVMLSTQVPTARKNPGWFSLVPPTSQKPAYVQWEFAEPFTCRALSMQFDLATGPSEGVLQVSDDGKDFRDICLLPQDGTSRVLVTVAFQQATGRYYRILVTSVRGSTLTFSANLLAAACPDRWELKAGSKAMPACNNWSSFSVPAEAAVHRDKLIDITSKLASDGRLEWEVPEGNWTILRIGHTSTGKVNAQATAAGAGLEVDKIDPKAVETHFNAMLGKLITDVGPLAGKAFRYAHIDSWEAQSQNWTPAFRTEFIKRRGYDPLFYLPAMTGRVIENVEVTERFLWDLRRTIGDLIAENHFKLMQSLINRRGMQFQAEAIGPNLSTIADAMQCKIHTDIPMAEFWTGREIRIDCKEAASSAHLHGKSIVAAEAFTAVRGDWTEYPYSLKAEGDRTFCHGINRFVFHRYAHQPWADGPKPGMTMGQYGINLNRTNTWWNQSPAWLTYLARCQYLLQQGLFVGDVVYYYGEQVPNMLLARSTLKPVLPAGYDYDGCCRDELLSMSVRDGRVVLPSGMSYRLLMLPDMPKMTPQVAAKVKELVLAGATVIGPRPDSSPSLENYPACDEEIRNLAKDVWKDCDGQKVTDTRWVRAR